VPAAQAKKRQQLVLALAQSAQLAAMAISPQRCVNSGAASVANLSGWAESDDKSGSSGTARVLLIELQTGFRTCSMWFVFACP
jgi:hypothetical protein